MALNKDWKDYDPVNEIGDPSTPLSAAAIEDLESRVQAEIDALAAGVLERLAALEAATPPDGSGGGTGGGTSNSPDGSKIPPLEQLIVGGKTYVIQQEQVVENGSVLVETSGVLELFVLEGALWQKTAAGFWKRDNGSWPVYSATDPRLGAPDPPPSDTGEWVVVQQWTFDTDPRGSFNVYNGFPTSGNNVGGVYQSSKLRWVPGELQIVSDGINGAGCNVQAARTYGRWEVRCRMDFGSGAAPCLVLWPSSDIWPADGEIDFLETVDANHTNTQVTGHWGTWPTHLFDYATFTHIDAKQWHTWATEWEVGVIRYYCDGALLHTQTGTPGYDIPNENMSLAMQVDGPNGWIPYRDGNSPAEMTLHIDSVRILQRGAGGGGGGGGGSAPFAPTNGVLDAFNRANGGLGASWTSLLGGGVPAISSNGVIPASWGGGVYTTTYGPDAEAFFTISTTSSGWGSGPLLRWDNAAFTGYGIWVTGTNVEISRWNAGVQTILDGDPASFAAGDKVYARVVGSVIDVYRYNGTAWSLALSVTDGSPVSGSGKIGFQFEDGGTNTLKIDDFSGGTL